MSIRIHKVLGYGIKDIDHHALFQFLDENQKNDEVANLLEPHKDILDIIDRPDMAINHGWNFPHHFLDVAKFAENPDIDGGWFVIMTPAMWEKWYRFDDELDYIECKPGIGQSDIDMLDTVVKEYDTPLYPYVGWMNAETGEKLPYDVRDTSDAMPAIPLSVQLIATHCSINWKQLRPVLVRWWC